MKKTKLDILIEDNKEVILQWIEDKKTITEMARNLKCDRGSFRNALKRANIYYSGQQGGPKYSETIGKQFGNLIVIRLCEKNELNETQKQHRGSYWECKCIKCGNKTIVKGTALRAGQTIGDGCERSRGELKIKQIFSENSIPYKKEFTFNDCKINNGKAKFDFCVFEDFSYSKIKYCIEFDGKQHFQDSFSKWEKSEEDFLKRKQSDIIKNNYCKKNNIPLIRIPYTHYENMTLSDLVLETSKFIV